MRVPVVLFRNISTKSSGHGDTLCVRYEVRETQSPRREEKTVSWRNGVSALTLLRRNCAHI